MAQSTIPAPDRYAMEGMPCKGFNENTGMPYPECYGYFTCATRYDVIGLPGAECTWLYHDDFDEEYDNGNVEQCYWPVIVQNLYNDIKFKKYH